MPCGWCLASENSRKPIGTLLGPVASYSTGEPVSAGLAEHRAPKVASLLKNVRFPPVPATATIVAASPVETLRHCEVVDWNAGKFEVASLDHLESFLQEEAAGRLAGFHVQTLQASVGSCGFDMIV